MSAAQEKDMAAFKRWEEAYKTLRAAEDSTGLALAAARAQDNASHAWDTFNALRAEMVAAFDAAERAWAEFIAAGSAA